MLVVRAVVILPFEIGWRLAEGLDCLLFKD